MDDAALARNYQSKTDKQHVLDNPDTYVGSTEVSREVMWVFEESSSHIVPKDMEWVPALYKLFDESIVNCRDHVIRMLHSPLSDKQFVSSISVAIDADGTLTLTNDGSGVDVAKHPETGVWIPEMVFGHLRTSTNYDKTEKKIVGGKNGFGVKLVFVWSTYGRIETVDAVRGLRYVQEFRNNLDVIGVPKITSVPKTTKPFTRVTFLPDYARLGLPNKLSADMVDLFKKRVCDIAALTDQTVKKVKVIFKGPGETTFSPVPVKSFQHYVDLYVGAKDETKRIYERPDERWEYAVALSTSGEFMHVSFVNGICTFKGGKHVDYILGQLTRKLADYIEKKKKIKVSPSSIKEQLILFLRCDIENPTFDSQTKDFMSTAPNRFGSSCVVSDAFVEKVAKMGIMDMACSLSEAKEGRLAKKTDGTKTKNIRGIANLIDANWSGTKDHSKDCVLILCEGLSALSGIVSGLSSEDRNTVGIYPLKGKLLNVRGESVKKVSENKEITDIKKVLGLEAGRMYESLADVQQALRYGKVLIMTDQDLDGSHIKGLVINLFHVEWPSLLKIPGFLAFMNTPILRAKKGQQTLLFYNDGEYLRWKDSLVGSAATGWTIKYFKGLGTSTSAEFKEYMRDRKSVLFQHEGDGSDAAIDSVFNKKRADDRKTWLEQYDKTAFLDTSLSAVSYDSFMNKELRHFSIYDCARSIPNMVDGLKTSLRKILFCAFKRKLTTEIKVAQFSGYVSEHSAYHHGEASLNGAIVNMAQTFVGSNNVNLLEPNGQFGTRLQGGDDSASERYIFTQLNPLTRHLFPEADDAVLTYLDDDGTPVEPEFYVPILPFVLFNGISGIGTGFSCNIPAYSPKQVVRYLRNKLMQPAQEEEDFLPYYEGFTGTVQRVAEKKFLVKGKYVVLGEDKIRITELPVGTWTMPYIAFLESLMDGIVDAKTGKKSPPVIRDFTSMCTELVVDITVVFPKGKLTELEGVVGGSTVSLDGSNHGSNHAINGVEKLLKLSTTVSNTNMHLFDQDKRLHKYDSVQEIIAAFVPVRMATYAKRKAALVADLEYRLKKLSGKAKFILATLEGTIDLRKKSAVEVETLLLQHGFDPIDGDFKYLVKMSMDSVTAEHVQRILKEKADAEQNLLALLGTTLETMWLQELDAFEREYDAYTVSKHQGIHSGTKSKRVVSSTTEQHPSKRPKKTHTK
jgi:DNA topoisomerase-2